MSAAGVVAEASEWWSAGQVMRCLRVSRRRVDQLEDAGDLPQSRRTVGGWRLWRSVDVLALQEKRRQLHGRRQHRGHHNVDQGAKRSLYLAELGRSMVAALNRASPHLVGLTVERGLGSTHPKDATLEQLAFTCQLLRALAAVGQSLR